MTPQSVIIPPNQSNCYFIAVNKGSLTSTEVLEQIEHMLNRKQALLNQTDDCIYTSVSFGLEFWKEIHKKVPQGLIVLDPINSKLNMPASPTDVFIHIASDKPDVCVNLAMAFFETVEDELEVVESEPCFRYFDKRDFTGFIEGTENPVTQEEREDVALIPEGDFKDGSFVFAQRYVHNLPKWNNLDTNSQEKVFGRTKADSIEFPEDEKPKNAHIVRTTIDDKNGNELHILRHSLSYGTATGEKGLFFVAYTKDLLRIDTMLERMFGASNDGISDKLLEFTTPQPGAFYFCPSEELLTQVIEMKN